MDARQTAGLEALKGKEAKRQGHKPMQTRSERRWRGFAESLRGHPLPPRNPRLVFVLLLSVLSWHVARSGDAWRSSLFATDRSSREPAPTPRPGRRRDRGAASASARPVRSRHTCRGALHCRRFQAARSAARCRCCNRPAAFPRSRAESRIAGAGFPCDRPEAPGQPFRRPRPRHWSDAARSLEGWRHRRRIGEVGKTGEEGKTGELPRREGAARCTRRPPRR